MAKITVKADCGNSPKKEFIRDFNIAFAEGRADFIIEHAAEEIQWNIYGDKELVGKEAFSKEVNIMKEYLADELIINSIVTHGNEGAANGEMIMGSKRYVFCDMYTFNSAGSNQISRIDSYVVKVE